jgi:hypothetical protein
LLSPSENPGLTSNIISFTMNRIICVSCISLILLLLSCTSEDKDDPTVDGAVSLEEGFTPHPDPDRMPHPETDAQELTLIKEEEQLLSIPDNLQLLYHFLNNESDYDDQELTVFASSIYDFYASSIDESTLIMLDGSSDRLIQYNLEEGNYADLAPQGRGPGDILFTREMQLFDHVAYVAMQGFRISIFDCRQYLCEYDSTITTDFNNYSVAPTGEELVVLGLPRFGHEQDPDPDNIDQSAIHIINDDGETDRSFSPVYQHIAPIVREQMNSRGSVRSFPEQNTQIVMYNIFPYIYLYNNQGELTKKYRLPDFQQGYYDFDDDQLIGRFRHNNNSNIVSTTRFGDDWVFIQLRDRRNLEWVEDHGLDGNQWYTYYAFNVSSHDLYKIGRDNAEQVGENRAIFPVEHGLVINNQGTLQWIGI